MKKTNKKIVILGLAFCLSMTFTIMSFAGEWKADSFGCWYVNDDGTYPANRWQEIDGIWYYFYETGYMACSTTTPDGYWVGVDGAWIEEGETGANEDDYIDNGEEYADVDEYREALYEVSTRGERKEAVINYLKLFEYDADYLVIGKNRIEYQPPAPARGGFYWVGQEVSDDDGLQFTEEILLAVLDYVNAEGQMYGYYKRIGNTDEFEYLEKRDAVEVYAEKLIELVEG